MINDLKKYINFKNPLFQFFLFITFFGIVATVDLILPTSNPAERNQYILRFVFTFVTGFVVYYITRYGFGLIASNPLNFAVSTWIVFLLIHPTNDLWYFPVAIVAITLGKFLFRKNNLPVINPASLAIVLTTIISMAVTLVNPEADTLLVSWWGADMFQNITSTIPVLNVLIPSLFFLGFLYFANSFKKIPYVISFFVTFLLATFIGSITGSSLQSASNLVFTMIFNATAFCALVMLPEPKTSPNFQKQQIIIGFIAGISLFGFNRLSGIIGGWSIDPMISTIILANIVTLIAKSMPRKPVATSVIQPTNVAAPTPQVQAT